MASELLKSMLAEDNLWSAWEHVRAKRAGPGLDRMTVGRAAEDPYRLVDTLRREIARGRYEPWPLRRVWLPKRRGGWRPIGVGTVRDRVAQRAMLQVLGPRAEPGFNPTSFAYRPGRGVRDAVRAVEQARDAGHTWVFEADIDDCFDSLDRGLLGQELDRLVPEPDARRLLDLWLTAGVVDRGRHLVGAEGVAQGDILSPLYCNLYLDALDDSYERASGRLVRYADDFIVLCRTARGAARAQARAAEVLAELRLRLEPEKTRVTRFADGFQYLGVEFHGSFAVPLGRQTVTGRDGLTRVTAVPTYELDPPPPPAKPGPANLRRWGRQLDEAAAQAAHHGRRLPATAEGFREALEEEGIWEL